ncbi:MULTISPECIES: SDR family oxidoreductase [Alphaproteobacteria]|uniref:NAD(P)-dependent oxidoreductase n=2 Tax=Alphaproteobacteria TaxID=28211 RepID=A0A512HE33_9HYPH|nr:MULTISPECIES: SDR family oxidoreductase [Alphaproteobacteria]GEO83712.1 NAD(P)-dependent oxidoreductase [Ciceribacter naphthalenivorans]GLR24136.1 NAD(P)-dependent oxidoreductase [Ciceribacter naphthalenivorans]GLT06992.1 NAD(P)-dependent oxidoreductase [Sphingomonas psychrolutea]
MHVMIFGAGYSGKAIGRLLSVAAHRVSGTTRSLEKTAALGDCGIVPFVFDGSTLTLELRTELATVTHLVQSIAPGRDGDPLIRLFGRERLETLMPKLEWVAYLSTVGVYGDHAGAWVDEDTVPKPVSERSVERVKAEQAWQALAEKNGLPLAILRLSGIYGPGRNAFVNLANGTARRLVKKDQMFNRIRVEDIARAAVFLAERCEPGIFNVTDNEPSPPQDVVSEAARLMGIDPPPEQAFETAELSPMARSFYGENKRVSNARLQALGFAFRHENYRQSLNDLWLDGSWNKAGA